MMEDNMTESTNELVSIRMNLKVLKCLVCLIDFPFPIFHCESGHGICSFCRVICSNKCPTCDSHIHTAPFLPLQSIIESIRAPCTYSSFGCNKDSISLKEKVSHEQKCSFIPCYCPIESCNFQCSTLLLSAHIKKNHSFAQGRSFVYNNWFTTYLRQGDDFQVLYGSDDQVFLLLKKCSKSLPFGFNLSVVCLQSGFSEKCYGYKLSVYDDDGNKVSLQSYATRIQQWRRDLPMGVCLSVPFQTNRTFMSNAEVSVCIMDSQ